MNLRAVAAIVAKDLRAVSRDRFYVLISLLGLAAYVALYWVLPSDVDETLQIGVHAPGLTAPLAAGLAVAPGEGIAVVPFDDADSLRAAVEAGTDGIVAGLDVPADLASAVAEGRRSTMTVYLQAQAPGEVREALDGFARELAFAVAGVPSPVQLPALAEIVLGTDRVGDQLALQDRFRPLFAFLMLMVETFALATLVAGEISRRTVVAVLVTPTRAADFLAAKAVVGTLLAFTQALLLLLLIGALGASPFVLIVAMLLGAVLVTAIGLVAGSSGRDFLGIVFISMLFVLPLTIPAFAALFPGAAAGWVRALPTFGLVQTIIAATADGARFADVAGDLGVVALWAVGLMAVGVLVLRRKVATL